MRSDRCDQPGCTGFIVTDTDWLGRVRYSCPECERRAAGLCRDCSRPAIAGYGGRCVACAKHAERQRQILIQQQDSEKKRRGPPKQPRKRPAREPYGTCVKCGALFPIHSHGRIPKTCPRHTAPRALAGRQPVRSRQQSA